MASQTGGKTARPDRTSCDRDGLSLRAWKQPVNGASSLDGISAAAKAKSTRPSHKPTIAAFRAFGTADAMAAGADSASLGPTVQDQLKP